VPCKNNSCIYTYIASIFSFSIVITCCCFLLLLYLFNNCVLTTVATSLEYRFYFHSRFISRHFVVGGYFAIRFTVMSLWPFLIHIRHAFWSVTHYSISLWYTRNIVLFNGFYIILESKFFLSTINTISNWRISLSKICHSYNVNLNIKGTFSGSDEFTTTYAISVYHH
jgi:hypothetical protein